MDKKPKGPYWSPKPLSSEDVLFGGNFDDPDLNACINHWGYVDDAYKSGFRSAALQLAERQCEHPELQDHIVYPIVFLYRHHTEMVLKGILRLSIEILQAPPTEGEKKALKAHNIGKLWRLVSPKIPKLCSLANEPKIPKDQLLAVQAYVAQLDEHDPNGMSFRYAYDLNSMRTLPEKTVHINIRSFAIHMEKLSDYLSGFEWWLRGLLAEQRNR